MTLDKYEIKTLLPSRVRIGDFLRRDTFYCEIIDIIYGFNLYHITFKIPTQIPRLTTSDKESYTLDEIIAYEHSPIKIKRFSLKYVLNQI